MREIINALRSEAKPKLQPWTVDAFNDITWQRHGQSGTAEFGKGYTSKYYPSLERPDAYWFMMYSEKGNLAWSPGLTILQTT